jgi:hypothetical protein
MCIVLGQLVDNSEIDMHGENNVVKNLRRSEELDRIIDINTDNFNGTFQGFNTY